MFSAQTYQDRRRRLATTLADGLVVLLGNHESPMNYTDNIYPFRQDSNFLYYTGLDQPALAVVIDTESGETTLYGDDLSLDDIVWMGAQPLMRERADLSGIEHIVDKACLLRDTTHARQQGRKVHYLPPYRADNLLVFEQLLGMPHPQVKNKASVPLIEAIVQQRSYKSAEELAEMERAVNVTREMHHAAMRHAKPGVLEAQLVGIVEGAAIGGNGRLAYPAIVTVNGHILHNHYHGNELKEGQLLLIDAGAETQMHYAGDITRTFPVGKTFSSQQRDIYTIVLKAEEDCINQLAPGIAYRDVHCAAAQIIVDGLRDLGLMRGSAEEAVKAGAHALFMPHGLGHMIGLDVHDMEDLGEDYVGYTSEIMRSGQFGTRSLRLGRELETGFVLTVEPGIYFIPALIDQWKADKKHADFINYDKLGAWRDFGGIRIEDNVVITENSHRVLGEPIAKTIEEVEELRKEAF